VTRVVPDTLLVVTVKVAEVAPDATVTLAGIPTVVLLSVKAISDPPEGAGPLSLTVAVDEVPPVTVVGFRVRERMTGGLIVREVWIVAALYVADTVAMVALATALVVIVKLAVVVPAATVTLAGIVADVLLSDKVTTAPPLGAGPFSVTVPVELVPPVTVVGFRVKELSAGGLIVNPACTLAPL
jgi:hypothetical protein